MAKLSIVTVGNQSYLTDHPEAQTFQGYPVTTTVTNADLHKCVTATLLGDLITVTCPANRVIQELSQSLKIVYDTYVTMAKQAKKLALNRATVEELNVLISSLGK